MSLNDRESEHESVRLVNSGWYHEHWLTPDTFKFTSGKIIYIYKNMRVILDTSILNIAKFSNIIKIYVLCSCYMIELYLSVIYENIEMTTIYVLQ